MNSYPHEFLAHPQPLMFVAGLTPSKSEPESSQTLGSSLETPSETTEQVRSRSGSLAATATLEAPSTHAAGALTTPISSPRHEASELPLSPTQLLSGHESTTESPGQGSKDEDEFEALTRHLRESLEGLGRRNKVWLRGSERRNFRVMLVDKGVRLPLRKVSPTSTGSQSPSAVPHSPLSPLTTSSPLYPDGLLAPIWVKKHAEMVPSVFVMFLRLYEAPSATGEHGAAADPAAAQARREAEKAMEKDADEGLVKEIAERRRRLGERGIKLTVVLMASAAALDSPSLDARLSYLRRASQLSSKASLFVLSPVPADQLPEFVQSLQDALYEHAMEYYNQHAKRVKRKRSRLPSTGSSTPTPMSGQGKVLPPQGWIVRYEWKAGWFAEIRGEIEEARRHYEDCWNELARMFASTQVLPPRTKRWAEAKVLADCVAMRICRLLLYADEGSKVLGPFYIHLKRFGDYSRGWGIGEDTFEFWSWIARQYRIFAELLELGVQAGMRIPRIAAPIFPSLQSAVSPPSLEDLATPISANNPLHILQPPAFYYYTAALCSVQRQQRFQDALATEQESLEASVAAGYSATVSPGYDNEKKVDHAALIIELYTKAYSLFKEQEQAQDRTALYAAYRIAETYCANDQYDLAMRFFDRISQTFKKDKWAPIVRQIRELWYTCAQRTGHVEHAARLLVEMMSPDSGIEDEDRVALQDDLISLMKTTSPASEEPISIDIPADSPLVSATAAYWQAEAHIGAPAAVQISLICPEVTHVGKLHFESATVVFGGTIERPDFVIKAGSAVVAGSDGITDVRYIASYAADGFVDDRRLAFEPGQRIIWQGSVGSEQEGEISIDFVRLRLVEGSWKIDIVVPVLSATAWETKSGRLPAKGGASIRPYDVSLDLKAPEVAYVAEQTPVEVIVANNDDRDVRVSMLPFLEGSSEADQTSLVVVDAPAKGMHGYDLGIVKARTQITRLLHLKAGQEGGKRIDIAVRVSAADVNAEAESSNSAILDLEQSADIVAHQPFTFAPQVSYGAIRRTEAGNTCSVVVNASIAASLQGNIEVESVGLRNDHIDRARLIWSSMNHCPFVPETSGGVPVNEGICARFELSGPADRVSLEAATALSPAHLEVRWRSDPSYDYTTTQCPFPPLSFPTQNAFLSARISHPGTVQNQRPFNLTLTVDNSHPTQSMSGLVTQVDMSDSFVWHGERTTRLPAVQPDGSVEVQVVLVPVVSRAGRWELPRVRVVYPQKGPGEREEVRVEGMGVVEVRP